MNQMILGNLNRDILFISIIEVVMPIILTYVIAQNMSSFDMKVPNMIDSTSDASGVSPIAQNIETSTVLESENIGGVASVPTKCLGSALCPD
jgi:hypothetical protein